MEILHVLGMLRRLPIFLGDKIVQSLQVGLDLRLNGIEIRLAKVHGQLRLLCLFLRLNRRLGLRYERPRKLEENLAAQTIRAMKV